MARRIARAVTEGHPSGGPLVLTLALLWVAACGRGASPGSPAPGEVSPLGRPLETYQQLGLLAGPAQFPVVASFAHLAGPADSSYVLFGLSLPNSALRFEREGGAGFVAGYRVLVTFVRNDQEVARIERDETVRVTSFAETTRTDESVVFQDGLTLAPGTYEFSLLASDANSPRAFRASDTLAVTAYPPGRSALARPLIVYRSAGRSRRADAPDLVLNPRHTVPYGGEPPQVYIEAYDVPDPLSVVIDVLDEAGAPVWSEQALLTAGDTAVRHATVALPGATLPLGKLWVELRPVARAVALEARTPLVISISDQWMVANFDEVLEFIRYIASPQEIDSLGAGSPAERRERWDRFWSRRDPLPASPVNEFRDEFFQRVRFAAEQFAEPGVPGWKTDRGEVFIVLGPPDFAHDRYVGGRADVAGRPNGIEWLYDALPGGRLSLLFLDRTGFGRYELAPASEAAFRAEAGRLRR